MPKQGRGLAKTGFGMGLTWEWLATTFLTQPAIRGYFSGLDPIFQVVLTCFTFPHIDSHGYRFWGLLRVGVR